MATWTRPLRGCHHSKMNWLIINLLGLVVAPAALIWGWFVYSRTPNRTTWRMHASLAGLLTPIISIAVWVATLALARAKGWGTSDRVVHRLITIGIWVPLIGLFVCLFSRPPIP